MARHITAPPSKSYTHRAIISAFVTRAKVRIENPLFCDDTLATIKAIRQFGVLIDCGEKHIDMDARSRLELINPVIDCGESASTLRMLMPMALLFDEDIVFTGGSSLKARPITSYTELFDKEGVAYQYSGKLPITISGMLYTDYVEIDSSVSSQFVSGLIYYMAFQRKVATIKLLGKVVSKKYIDMTIDVLKQFGVDILFEDDVIEIKSFKEVNLESFTVEGDYSQAAFFIAYGLFKEDLVLANLKENSLQADRVIVDIVKDMGGKVVFEGDSLLVNRTELKGMVIDVENSPDLAPPVSLIASLSNGRSVITGTKRLRVKESDRIHSTVSALKNLGVDIHAYGDDIVIEGSSLLNSGRVDSYDDHRIVMMSAMAGLIGDVDVEIIGREAVSKSYPRFFEDIKVLR